MSLSDHLDIDFVPLLDTVIEVQDLTVEVADGHNCFTPVRNVSFRVSRGECLGIVGESGSGKSLTLRAINGLLPPGVSIVNGAARFALFGRSLEVYSPDEVRGRGVAMVFQEPMVALNPTRRVLDLVADSAESAGGLGRRAARACAIELLKEVGIPDPEVRGSAWPWQLSGGLRQRVMIAVALAASPHVILCDEPTTALDVGVQDQILRLLRRLQRNHDLAVVFVSHDLAVVSQIADRIAVMYAGRIIETGPTDEVLQAPRHAYTAALLATAPSLDGDRLTSLSPIPGSPPDPRSLVEGCAFAPRCTLRTAACLEHEPGLRSWSEDRQTACLEAASVTPVVFSRGTAG